jgi:hypothetical protein
MNWKGYGRKQLPPNWGTTWNLLMELRKTVGGEGGIHKANLPTIGHFACNSKKKTIHQLATGRLPFPWNFSSPHECESQFNLKAASTFVMSSPNSQLSWSMEILQEDKLPARWRNTTHTTMQSICMNMEIWTSHINQSKHTLSFRTHPTFLWQRWCNLVHKISVFLSDC